MLNCLPCRVANIWNYPQLSTDNHTICDEKLRMYDLSFLVGWTSSYLLCLITVLIFIHFERYRLHVLNLSVSSRNLNVCNFNARLFYPCINSIIILCQRVEIHRPKPSRILETRFGDRSFAVAYPRLLISLRKLYTTSTDIELSDFKRLMKTYTCTCLGLLIRRHYRDNG